MDVNLRKDLIRYVPNRELESTITSITKKAPKGLVTKEELIEKLDVLMKKQPEATNLVNNLVRNYRYAGKRSISWSVPAEPIKFAKDQFEKLIKERTKSEVFDRETRSTLTKTPSLSRASWLNESKSLLEFAYAGAPYLEEIDYELEEIVPTRRASVLIRFLNCSPVIEDSPVIEGSPVIECRANARMSNALHERVSNILGFKTNILKFQDSDIRNIKKCLKAQKKFAKHKMSAGDFDTLDVSAAPIVPDLDDSDTYQNLCGSDELRQVRYTFSYLPQQGSRLDVTIYLTLKGHIWFVSEVPEEVIDHVFSSIAEVKGLKTT